MNYLIHKDVVGIVSSIRDKIREKKSELIKLDSELGDGDLGLTMDAGFSKLCETFATMEQEKISVAIKRSGLAMAGAAPSTMGTLVATGIMKSSEAIKSEDRIAAEDIPEMLKKAIVGIEQRGKAKRGDKTLLDALYPALEASEVAVSEGKSLRAIVEAAYSGSKTGVESTKQMKSTWGKAAVYGDKSIGKQDPGATAVMYVFEGIVNYFNGLSA